MGDAELVRALRQFNTHWESGEVSELIKRNVRRRRSFSHLKKRLSGLPFEVLAGPRQVGKTTLLGHLMESLIADGVPPARIAYVPVDFPPLALEMDGRLEPVLRAYERFVLKEELSRPADLVFLFLDEIQTLPDWGAELKGLHDAYHPRLRVLATGSSSAALLNAPTADFPGRVERSHIHPLKFSEALENVLPGAADLVGQARSVRAAFAEAAPTPEGRRTLTESLRRLYAEALPVEGEIRRALDVYLVRGGFPAAQPPASREEAFRFFENTLDTVLSKDLKLYEKVRKPGAFRSFLAKLAKEHGGKFVSAHYGKDLGVDKETPATWKAIAEELFLVHQLPQLNESFHVVPGRADKAYLQDAGVRAYLSATADVEDLERSGAIGTVVEGVLFDHLRRMQFNAFSTRSGRIGYWDKPEVDFIVELPRLWLAIECKYRSDPRSGTRRMQAAFAEHPTAQGIVVTRDSFDVEGDIWHLPLWLVLLLA